ncbi:mitochondrial membrane protein [Dinochytrium kinnereticum]|nr:mitochondrial membrane protein [Dinochytrium kinnereticum]
MRENQQLKTLAFADHTAVAGLEIYKENPSRRRECLYYLSLGNYKLGNYRDARKFNETLLQMEPRNPQAVQLRKMIDEKVRSEGLVGMAIVGAAVATVGVLVAGLIRKAT